MDIDDSLLSFLKSEPKVEDHLEVVEFIYGEEDTNFVLSTELYMTEIESALDSLFRAEEHIKRVENNAFHWKWVIICLHNSLYILTLTFAAGTNRYLVQQKNPAKSNSKKPGKFKVIDFIKAVRLCLETPPRFMYSVPFELTPDQKNSILWLQDLRNEFEHFTPNNNWTISLWCLPNICIHVLEAIKSLALDCESILYHLEAGRYCTETFKKNSLAPWVDDGGAEMYYTEYKRNKIRTSIERSIQTLRSSRFYGQDNQTKKRGDLSKLDSRTHNLKKQSNPGLSFSKIIRTVGNLISGFVRVWLKVILEKN